MTLTTHALASPSRVAWGDVALTALAPVIWGSTYIVTTELLPPGRPFAAALWRCLPAGLLLVLYARRLPGRGEWPRVLLLAALNIAAFQALLFVAAYRLPGGLAAVIGAIQPLLVMGLSWAVDARRPGPLALGAALAAIAGMAALLLAPTTAWDPIGVAAAAAGAACMAAGTFLARRWRADLPVLAFTGWQLLLGGLMLAPAAAFLDPPLVALSVRHIAGYAYLAFAGALVSYALWFRGVARLPTVAVSALALLSPVSAVILGWTLLDQAMRGLSLLGMVVVIASILVLQLAMSERR